MQRRPRNPGFGRGVAQEKEGGVSDALLNQARKSGQLNLSNRGLTKVPDKVWRVNLEVPLEARNVSLDCADGDKWWEIVDVTKLILASNKLTEISSEIVQFPALTVLDVHDNSLTMLPNEIGQLVNLKRLNLSHNKLSSLPSSLGCLDSLSSLKMDHNNLTSLEIELGKMVQLEEMDLSHNSLRSLRPSLGNCHSLRHLNLSQNSLEYLPPEIGHLHALRDLNLSNNKLSELPKDIGKLSNLERLDCRHNHLTSVPLLSSCQSLKELYLGNNKITSLNRESFASMTSLSIFGIRDNKINSIPDEITVLKKLERLDLANNDISGLPYTMGTMEHIKSLVLDGNPLRSLRRDVVMRGTQAILKHLRSRIPEEEKPDATDAPVTSLPVSSPLPTASSGLDVHTITSTKTLNYSNKKSTCIPDDVWDAAISGDVSTVNLSKNALSEVPSRLLSLGKSLTDLNVSLNKISSLPSEFGCLSKLSSLNLSINQLSDLPDSFSRLTTLREINISNNRFKNLPSVLYSLKSLEIILASGNQIQVIEVESLLPMSSLSTLDLQNNDIAQVPPQLGNVTQLRSLQLEGNPFRNPRAAILAKGTQALLAYLRDRIPT
ncbi:leucine-rich repeat-containing protein 40-like [Porites lutea]|uniref:leucine-rich repeat-containing protein 40-like n=1 Tax=Porites lutea TaxID=51062 RepID=UPI003CC56AAB